MTHPFDLIVIGSYVQDHAWLTDRFPVQGETCRALGFNSGPGGKGFNQAIAAHRQGARVLFIGAIGEDPLGRVAQGFGREAGLSCLWQVTPDAPTAASSIVIDHGGRNQIVVSLGANEHLDPAFLASHRDAMAGAKTLLLQLENNLDAVMAAADLASELGMRLILNPAPMHAELDAGLLARIDLITPNESEFALLLDRFVGTQIDPSRVAELSDDALHAYCRKLGVPTVVITLGEHGCFVSHGSGSPFGVDEADRYRIPPEVVDAVDSTGAGDAFNGALVAAMVLGGASFRDMVEHANRSAALSTETVGTAPAMPTRDDVLRRFGAG